MPDEYDSLDEAVADIFEFFDECGVGGDITRLVVYGSALDDVSEATGIDLVVVGPVGAELDSELDFHRTVDEQWPEERFGPADHLVLGEEQYRKIADGEVTPDDRVGEYIIEAVEEGEPFVRHEVGAATSILGRVRALVA